MIIESVFKRFPAIETERLLLREMRSEDGNDLFQYFSNKELSKYLSTYGPKSTKDAIGAIRFFNERFSRGKTIRWAIVPKNEGRMAGSFSYEYFDGTRSEIAYELSVEHWGRGMMSEVFKSVIPFGFGEIGLHRIQATVHPLNIASLKLLEKFGFQNEGLLREYSCHHDKQLYEDRYMLSLLSKDYQRLKGSAYKR